MIRELTKNYSNRIIDPEAPKRRCMEMELENYESGGDSGRAYPRNQKKKKVDLQGEFRNMKPPTFGGEKEEDVEVWLLNMTKYFEVYEYERNIKDELAIYQLQGKVSLWWEEIKTIHSLEHKTLSQEELQRNFKSNI